MNTIIERRKPKRGKCCCIQNCKITQTDAYRETHFYRFPKGEYKTERRRQWILAIGKINSDGSLWQPSVNSRICSQHFVGNKKSEHPHSPSYNPTIFPPRTFGRTVPRKKGLGSMIENTKCIIKEKGEEANRVTKSAEKNFRKKGIDLRKNPEKEKLAKNIGRAYINCQGRLVPARSVKIICVESAKYPCYLDCGQRLIAEEKRQEIFQNFWDLPNRLLKHEFICRNIKLIVPKTRSLNPSSGKNRNYSRLYHLPIDGKLVRVCKRTFIATLDLNEQWLLTSLKKFGHLSSEGQLDQEENDLQLRSTDTNITEEFEKKFLVDDLDHLNIPEKKRPDAFMNVCSEGESAKCIVKEEVFIKDEVDSECGLTHIDERNRVKINIEDFETKFLKQDLDFPIHSENNDTDDEMDKLEIECKSNASMHRGQSLKKACDNYCLYNCRAVSEEQRRQIFQDFRSITDNFGKYEYISRLVEQTENKSEVSGRRKFNRKYFLEIKGEFRRVCRIMFTTTLDITIFKVQKALKKLGARAVVSVDDIEDTEIGPIL